MPMMKTTRTTAMHAPMIPHIAAFEIPDEPRSPTSGPPCVPVVVSVVGVVGGGVAKNNKKMNQEGIKVDLILTVARTIIQFEKVCISNNLIALIDDHIPQFTGHKEIKKYRNFISYQCFTLNYNSS